MASTLNSRHSLGTAPSNWKGQTGYEHSALDDSKHAFLQQGMFWGANVIPPFVTATERRNQQTKITRPSG